MAGILDSLMGMLGPQVVGPVASQLGESTETVQRGLQTGSAAMLAGLAAKVGQPGFLSQIFSLITNPANSSGALSSLTSNPASLLSGTTSSPLGSLGSQFLSNIFGSNMSSVTDAIGRSTGLAGGKAGSLLSMAAPLVLGVLGQHVRQNGLSAGDLGNTLKAEASSFQRFLPSGLGSLLGGASSTVAAAQAKVAAAPAEVAAAGNRWLWPLILLALLVIAALWYFNRAKAPETTEAPPPATAPAPALPAGFFTLKLPDGVELNVPQTGIENKLAMFIADSSKPVDTTTWFDFDRLTFDTGKDTLQPSSQEQLNNVVAILKAYPNVRVKIGGYTDNTGNAAANLKLSDDRAKNVMNALVAGGIDQTRLEAKGYGKEHPVASNDTEEGRAQNRRISLLVTAK
jgi:OmpA-OmpF porin, OOP family